MFKTRCYSLILLFFLIVANLSGQDKKKVLIIGIDGVRSDALIQANTPNIDQLISNAIYSPHTLNDDITISGPGWSAILCGVWSDSHLVTGNDFSVDNYDAFPSIFKHIDDLNPGLNTLSICNWGPINDFIIQEHVDFKLNVGSDQEVSTQASNYIAANDPDLIFLHFDNVDHAGHSYGFAPSVSEYNAAIEQVDVLLGPVLSAIENRPNYLEEDWLILVTADHGGQGFSHGGNSLIEEEVFFIANGKNITPEIITRDTIVQIDTVENCLQDERALYFDGDNDFVNIPFADHLDFGTDQDFTIECRVRTDQSGDVAILGNKDWDTGINPGFVFSFKFPSGPEWKVNIGDGTNRVDIDNGGLIADNQWHTLSVTFDRDGFMKMYEDGIFIAEADISNIGNINTDVGIFLGTDFNSAYDYKGNISEVRIWNAVLDENSISEWACQRLDSSHDFYDQLLGYWQMNEASGTAITDHSSFGNHATASGASWVSPDMLITFDYAMTPRITDVAVTALEHLCISPNTAFDGVSRIVQCSLSNVDESDLSPIQFWPNPSSDFIIFSELPNNYASHKLSIFNSKGETIIRTNLDTKINIGSLESGAYSIQIVSSKDNQTLFSNKLIVP